MEIAIEGHARWNLPEAIRIARALEPYDVHVAGRDHAARQPRSLRAPQGRHAACRSA